MKFFSRLRGRRHARLTGISTPLFGLSWEYGSSEREAVQQLFAYLESRRALWIPFNSEDHQQVVSSVLAMREQLTAVQRNLSSGSPAIDSIRTMRLTCERFLTDTPEVELYFYSNLGELRGIFGGELGRLAKTYGIEVQEPLAWIIPPADEGRVGRFIPIGEIPRVIYVPLPPSRDPSGKPETHKLSAAGEGDERSDG